MRYCTSSGCDWVGGGSDTQWLSEDCWWVWVQTASVNVGRSV